ncbi:GntR family transcriptional regulator [Enterococcus sp. LJL128]
MKKKEFVAEDLLSKIYQKKYLPKTAIPSERKLMAEYQVSRNTVRKAIEKLKDAGLLVSIPGKGNNRE